MSETFYDLIIVGAGPAGLAAVIYAKRALLKTLIFEKGIVGGKLNKTEDVDNYPSFASIKGPELARKMAEHAKYYEISWQYEEVVKLQKKEKEFLVKTQTGNSFISKAIIIASGANENKLGIKGEKELTNRGVSYCAICDGFLFRKQEVAVIGGGYSALEAALYLSNITSRVYLIHRRSNFRAEREIVEKVKNDPKIVLFLESVLIEIKGQNKVEKLIMKNLLNGEERELWVTAIFPYIGLSPLSNLVHELGICDHHNYIKINDNCSTSVAGLFAAGDVARRDKKKVKQIVTAVAEGAIAAQTAIKYLKDNDKN